MSLYIQYSSTLNLCLSQHIFSASNLFYPVLHVHVHIKRREIPEWRNSSICQSCMVFINKPSVRSIYYPIPSVKAAFLLAKRSCVQTQTHLLNPEPTCRRLLTFPRWPPNLVREFGLWPSFVNYFRTKWEIFFYKNIRML